MATFLDAGIFSHFSIVFTFLLVYVIVYGVLEWSKLFGKAGGDENSARGLHAMLALAISFIVVLSEPLVRLINFTVPWFLFVALIAFFIIFIVKMFGGSDLDLKKAVTEGETRIYTWAIVFFIVILLFGLGHAFGGSTLEAGGGGTPVNTTITSSSGTDQFISSTGLGNTATTGTAELTATNDFGTNVINTIVNPKVLGLIIMLLVAVFAIFFLAD